MKLSFRQALEEDWELVSTIERQAASLSPRFFLLFEGSKKAKKYLRENKVFLVIKDNKPIGTVAYRVKNPKLASIEGLAIIPEFSGKGYGTEALKWVLEQIKNIGKVELVVHPQNSPAIRIYLKLGFQVIGWKDNFFGDGEPRLKMVKELTL